MKFPIVSLEDTNARLDKAEANMVELVESLHRVESLLEQLLVQQQQLAGVDILRK